MIPITGAWAQPKHSPERSLELAEDAARPFPALDLQALAQPLDLGEQGLLAVLDPVDLPLAGVLDGDLSSSLFAG